MRRMASLSPGASRSSTRKVASGSEISRGEPRSPRGNDDAHESFDLCAKGTFDRRHAVAHDLQLDDIEPGLSESRPQ